MSKLQIRWEVEDGYVGKSRPQRTSISIDELIDNCETEKDVLDYINDDVKSDFEQRISYFVTNDDEIVEAWKQAKADE